MAVHEHRRRAAVSRAKMHAMQFDLTQRQRGRGKQCRRCAAWERMVEWIQRGNETWSTFVSETEQNAQQRGDNQSIQAGGHVVEDDPPAAGQALQLTHGKGLGDVEEAEEKRGEKGVTPVGGANSSAIHWPATSSMTTKPGSLRPDSRATMVAAGMPRTKRRRCRLAERAAAPRGWRGGPWRRRPRAGQRRPSPMCRGQACRSLRRRRWRRPRPRGFCFGQALGRAWWLGSYQSSESPPRPLRPPRSSSTSGSRTGELIL